MPFQDKIAHAAAVAKWKADQQMRLIKGQNRISEIEGQVRAQKATLAEKALALYSQDQLTEDDLKQICESIDTLKEQIKEQQSLQEEVRNERPPEQQVQPSTQSTEVQDIPMSGLVCPQCNRPLVGKFCPEHGVEGVEPPQSSEPVKADDGSSPMVCPKCGKVLSVRFCPEHGVEGVPQSEV